MTTTADRAGRGYLAVPAAVLLIVCLGVVGCSSTPSKPAYCTAADQLKTSVAALGKVDVAGNGVNSLTTAVKNVRTSATTFANEAKSTFAPQTTALKQSLTSLDTAITKAKGQSVASAVTTLAGPLLQVKDSATQLIDAAKGKCS